MSTVDWSALPEKFRPLIPFFERYGSLQFEKRIIDQLEAMPDEELENVRSVFNSLLLVEDELDGWIDETGGITNSRAAALVYFTFHFLAIANDSGLLGEPE